MNAITTKYLGATDYKGSRIKATAGNGQTLTISYPHEYSDEAAAAQAAIALCVKLDWLPSEDGKGYRFTHLIGGGTKDGYAFVFALNPENHYNVYKLPMSKTAEKTAVLA